ncbi:tRNA dihydrouridine synthase DusB [Moorella sp. Hama-1]|uniref:tRNA dihydrouridine synthase DusB n=1 Tax=Moorella sp. Hama-1 TaxID=2138101 RepID=UPI000D655E5F|nr:tRNA dihydrouridine synthase DusB [Moorella sp. Hama-1]MDN5362142.1 tRNA-dihydrouridine synthase [Moorella sp. (in: firmicutes)]BCV20103.1 tRNA-dihydrouridine synthase [Moorella sp. Hama-1]
MSATLKIGPVTMAAPLVMAPLAGYTDRVFRLLAREAGAALTCTEMISAQGLIYNNKNTLALLDLEGEPGPVAVQLFGREPEVMARATEMAVAAGAAIIDLNMGCPTPKIVKNGEGSALMRDLPLAAAIVAAMVRAAGPVPVTVKMRLGWDEVSINVVDATRVVVDAGAAAVAIHGRTRSQFYSGRADWSYFPRVKEAVPVPVIGNGDVRSAADAVTLLEQAGCDGVMVGRGAIGNPWLLTAIRAVMEGRPEPPPVDIKTRLSMACRHLNLLVQYKGEVAAVKEMRKHLAYYLRGLRGAARLRQEINTLTTAAAVTATLEDFQRNYPE